MEGTGATTVQSPVAAAHPVWLLTLEMCAGRAVSVSVHTGF